jgi:ribonuclease P protein subunit RPR2
VSGSAHLTNVDQNLAIAQAMRYAEELRGLHASERSQRHAAETALKRLEESYGTTVRALAAALELRDDQTGGHAERVAELASRLTETIAPELAEDPQLEYGFLLHDLGKIGISDAILLKPGALDPAERRLLREHVSLGVRVLAGIPYLGGVAREVVAGHHERWDGTGYPLGLRAEEIPIAARIFAVADAFDAMTNDRPYRRALSVEAALDRVVDGVGSQFDPEVVEAFVALVGQVRRVA